MSDVWRRLRRGRKESVPKPCSHRNGSEVNWQAAREVNANLPRYRCILWGGYGWGNVGDELTLAVAIQDMKRRFGESVAILTRAPGYTRRLFPNCAIIPYEPKRRGAGFGDPESFYDIDEQLTTTTWARQLASCEFMYLVGGGYLSDLFWLDWLLLPMFVAQRCGTEIATAPLGLGPFQWECWAKRVAEALNFVTIAVRDDASLDYCQQRGLTAVRGEDDGFRLAEVLRIDDANSPHQPRPWRIGVNSFHQHGSTHHGESNAWWASLIKHLVRDNTIIEGFCFHNVITDDLAVTSECLACAGLDPRLAQVPDFDFRDACARLARFDAIISSRFHAIVVGNALGKQTYAVCDGDYYEEKMAAATERFSQSLLIRQFDSSPNDIAQRILQRLAVHAGGAAAA